MSYSELIMWCMHQELFKLFTISNKSPSKSDCRGFFKLNAEFKHSPDSPVFWCSFTNILISRSIIYNHDYTHQSHCDTTVAMVFRWYMSDATFRVLFGKFLKSLSVSCTLHCYWLTWASGLAFFAFCVCVVFGSEYCWNDCGTHSCTARAIDSAVEPVSLTLSKVTFGRSSSSLSLLICLGDRPLWSACAVKTWHRCRIQLAFFFCC